MSTYLKRFKTHTEYETYIDNAILPNVSYCKDDKKVHYNPWTNIYINGLNINEINQIEDPIVRSLFLDIYDKYKLMINEMYLDYLSTLSELPDIPDNFLWAKYDEDLEETIYCDKSGVCTYYDEEIDNEIKYIDGNWQYYDYSTDSYILYNNEENKGKNYEITLDMYKKYLDAYKALTNKILLIRFESYPDVAGLDILLDFKNYVHANNTLSIEIDIESGYKKVAVGDGIAFNWADELDEVIRTLFDNNFWRRFIPLLESLDADSLDYYILSPNQLENL